MIMGPFTLKVLDTGERGSNFGVVLNVLAEVVAKASEGPDLRGSGRLNPAFKIFDFGRVNVCTILGNDMTKEDQFILSEVTFGELAMKVIGFQGS
jgi:hypothetical protein